jgi:hypothetical protein
LLAAFLQVNFSRKSVLWPFRSASRNGNLSVALGQQIAELSFRSKKRIAALSEAVRTTHCDKEDGPFPQVVLTKKAFSEGPILDERRF